MKAIQKNKALYVLTFCFSLTCSLSYTLATTSYLYQYPLKYFSLCPFPHQYECNPKVQHCIHMHACICTHPVQSSNQRAGTQGHGGHTLPVADMIRTLMLDLLSSPCPLWCRTAVSRGVHVDWSLAHHIKGVRATYGTR